tara:strand:- start:997 stop:1701 length:705 start_codon:yes stop_codon:yes gene_type:complete
MSSLNDFPEVLLIIDTETTGLDPDKDKCIEIGSILYSVKKRAILTQHSFLLPVSENNAENINKINPSITTINQPWEKALDYFNDLVDSSEYLVAHNSAFDQQWFGKFPLPILAKKWICSMEDINWPKERSLRARPSVRDLALAYEVPVWMLHRALTDCIYIAEVFNREPLLEVLLNQALEPKQLVRANISYENRHLAKNASFTWNNPIPGAWGRRISQRERDLLEFDVSEVYPD